MSGSTVRGWFTPAVVIQLVSLGIVGLGLWFGQKSDIRSLSERQDRLANDVRELSAKVPDGAVIEVRLQELEKKVAILDPAAMASTTFKVDALRRDFDSFQDGTWGRIYRLRWDPPAKRSH